MKIFFRLIILIISLSMISSCAYKRLAKKASEYEENGMYKEAADLYYQSLLKKETYIDSRLGLKRTGQRVVDDKYSDFNKAYNQGNNKQAVYYYLEAVKYENKLERVGVETNVPPYYEEYYNEVKGSYLEDKYFEGKNHLAENQFEKAQSVFKEIINIEANYKDAKEKLNISIYEPKYRKAEEYLGNGKYRSAYYLFDDIIKNYKNYKGSADLKAEALEKGTIKIGVENFKNNTRHSKIDDQVKTKIENAISQSNNPFIKLVEYNKSGGFVSESSVKNTIPPDAVLKGEILSYRYQPGNLNKDVKKGYLKITKKKENDEGESYTETEYKKVKYDEYKMHRSVKINFSFQLVSTKNNQILITENYNLTNSDNLHYASYDGKSKNLVPGYWKNRLFNSKEDVVKNNRRNVRALKSLLNSRKKIKTSQTLTNGLINEIKNRAISEINSYNPEK